MPSTFTAHEISAGVWAAIAPGISGPAVSNAAIIDLGDKTVVVDTFMTLLAAEELRDEVQRLTGRTPFLVVNSHWHSDHVYGNQVFSEAPIAGTRRMLELIVEDTPTRQDYDNYVAYLRNTAADISGNAATPEQQQQAAGTLALAEALASDADRFQVTLPNVLVGDRLDIEGERSVAVINASRGHTESDLYVHLVDDDIVVTGDLLWTAMHPKTDDGFPAEWAASIDAIVALAPKALVSGHGGPATMEDLKAMGSYMRELDRLVAAARNGDVDPETVDPPKGSENWHGPNRFRQCLANLASQ